MGGDREPVVGAAAAMRAWLALLAIVGVVGCDRAPPEPQKDPEAKPVASSAVPAVPAIVARGVRIEKAKAAADAASLVKTEREAARALGRDLVVYVGAPWCEPCQRFHKAAQAGELDDAFPTLTLLEFDLDVDRDRLVAAGYQSTYIPLFVVPGEDGRATPKRFEGSEKGEGAVAKITPRLRTLLAR